MFPQRHLLTALCAISLLSAPLLRAQPAPAAAAPEAAPAAPQPERPMDKEFEALFKTIRTKLDAGAQTEASLAPELKAYDALIAKYDDKTSDEMAMLSIMKARLYLEVFEDSAKGIALLKKTKADYPTTQIAAKIDELVASIEAQAAADGATAVGKTFAPFAEQDLDGKPLALANYKGKIVLVDFWATWCGPCVNELPNVIAAYGKYHGKGFEIVGISLDEDRAALTGFIKEHAMTWQQFFDGQGWKNKLARQYGINAIPATFLLDGEGKIIAKNLRGEALDKKLAELLK